MRHSYYEQPEIPFCIIAKLGYYGTVIACRVPEEKAPYYVEHHGFTVLIADSEFPVPIDDVGTMPDIDPPTPQHAKRHWFREGWQS